jgi:hypothetical protein
MSGYQLDDADQVLARPVLAVPHTDLRLGDGRRLKRWADDDPRKRRVWAPGMLDAEGWSGPQQLIVLCSLDESRHGRLLHVSLSYQRRDPPWADIKLVRYLFYPRNIDVMMMLPCDDDYVSGVPDPRVGMDSHVFHLQQTPERWGLQ